MKKVICSVVLVAFALSLGGCNCCCKKEKVFSYDVKLGSKATVTPVSKAADADWVLPRHEAIVKRVAQGNVDLLMIGDSITHFWERTNLFPNTGQAVWDKYYANRNAVNMGFSGDQTQHVLWRLENGEIAGINPKLAVIMIGTNNTGTGSSPQDTADGIIAICQKLRTDLPKTKILLLAIFPRGADNNDKLRQTNEAVNKIIAKIADNKHIYFLNINDKFLEPDGTLPKSIMPDQLHPNEKGYEIWAEAQEPMIKKLMK